MTLERALRQAGDSVDALVDAWRINPHPRISAVASQLPASEIFSGLFAGTLAEIGEKIRALKLRRHPHLSNELERILREPPWSSNNSRDVWELIFELVAESKDPRFLALATELPTKWEMRSEQKSWLTTAIAAAVTNIPAVVELTPEQSALLHPIEREAFSQKPAPKRSATVDFAAVYVAPHDDAPRLVLADALLEQGEPRGEYLSLALRAQKITAEKKREKELLKTHGKAWLTPFGSSLGAKVEWRRGFPAEGLVKFRDGTDVKKYGALPEWATFESLKWALPRSPEHIAAAGFIGPAFRHLIRAEDIYLAHLLESASWALTHVRGTARDSAGLQEILAHRGLPKLESLHLNDTSFTAEWITTTSHWGTVRELGVTIMYPPPLPIVLAAAEASPLQRLQWGHALRFHRSADGKKLSRLELLDTHGVYLVTGQLNSLAMGCVEELVAPATGRWTTKPYVEAVDRVLRRAR